MKNRTNYRWDLKHLYKSDSSPQISKDRKASVKKISRFAACWSKNEGYLKDPKLLKKALDEYCEIEAHTGTNDKEMFYFSLQNAQNQDDLKVKAALGKAEEVAVKLINKIQFFFINLSKVDSNIQKKFLSSPYLSEYKHLLETLFEQSKYILSDKEEKIITMLSKSSFGNWVDMVERFLTKSQREVIDEKGRKKKLNFTEISNLLQSSKITVVNSAAKAIYEILQDNQEIAENEMNSILEYKKNIDELKKFERPDKARHISEDVDTKTIDVLLKTVTNNFDVAHKYYALKARFLKKKKLKYHERIMSLSKVDKKVKYSEAVKIVEKTFKKLDPDFANLYKKYLLEQRFDVFSAKGKAAGGFCASGAYFLPTYILLNYNERISDVTTIAHEMGHAINHEYARQQQNALNWDVPLLIAEFSSTFFEDFALDEILQEIPEKQKIYILMEKIGENIALVFRQTALYNFETELHATYRSLGYLSYKTIGDIFAKHMKAYLGEAVEFDKDAHSAWIHWSHIRRFFYVFSYVGGLLISKALQEMVRKDANFINDIKEIFSVGSSISPKMAFKKANINIDDAKIWESGVKSIENDIKEVEKLAERLKLI